MVSDKTYKLSCTSEAIWLTIKAPGSPSLDILTVYRPPRNDPTADARLIEDLERFSIRSEVLIMGDFNAPLIDWSSAYASGSDHAFDRRLLDMTFKLFLTQHVSFPTRVREGQQSNCLDLLLTKSLDSVDEVQCLPPLGRSDHVVLLWEYSIFSLPEQATRVRRNIWRGDFAQMKAELNTINWESAFSGDIIKDWDWFTTTTNLRGHPLKLRVTGAKLDTRKFFSSNRVIEAWNALPAGVVMSTSVEAFKRNLDQIATTRHNAT
nr:unnamed protein product [Spirometra erinaceieuropaei]